MEKPKSVEAYLAGLSPEPRAALQKLRETIAAAAPQAAEGITYGMPGFLLGGKDLVTGKGTISFAYGRRLPVTLVKKVVRTRLAELAARRP